MVETAVLVAIVIGVTEALKRAVGIKSRYVPLMALALGVLAAWLGNADTIVFDGIMVGLTSVGLYSGAKNTVK